MLDSTTRAAVEPFVLVLERLGVHYFIGGSVASIAYGEPRTTMDVDFVAALDPLHADSLASELRGAYYANAEQIHDAIRRRGSFNLISLSTSFKVDVFLPKDRPYTRSEFERRTRLKVGASPDLFLWFASAEDIVLNKLEWYRKGGEVSDRQFRDVLGILRIQSRQLDASYLSNWARELGLADLLARAASDAGFDT